MYLWSVQWMILQNPDNHQNPNQSFIDHWHGLGHLIRLKLDITDYASRWRWRNIDLLCFLLFVPLRIVKNTQIFKCKCFGILNISNFGNFQDLWYSNPRKMPFFKFSVFWILRISKSWLSITWRPVFATWWNMRTQPMTRQVNTKQPEFYDWCLFSQWFFNPPVSFGEVGNQGLKSSSIVEPSM